MFRKDFCEITLLKNMIATRNEWPNVIINTQTRQEYRTDIKGTLSIFSNIKGQAHITADNTTQHLGEETYFISNEEQLYGIDIAQSVETFNIHFSTAMLQNLVPAIVGKYERLLDGYNKTTTIEFANKAYWKDEYFRRTVQQLKNTSESGELNDIMTEEILSALLEHIYVQQSDIRKNIEQLDAYKHSTKEEVAKRLSIAVDYIHAHYYSSVTLDELALVACMSKFHFLRTFKQVYKLTPYQYIMSVRLDRAKQLLQTTQMPVSNIAAMVGYDDVSVFSRGFKRYYNYQPIAYRKLAQ